jgi:hypothetical protein
MGWCVETRIARVARLAPLGPCIPSLVHAAGLGPEIKTLRAFLFLQEIDMLDHLPKPVQFSIYAALLVATIAFGFFTAGVIIDSLS